jgi:hypothetical protein
MPRIAGCSYKEKDTAVDVLVQEQTKIIKQGGKSHFTISLWNLGFKLIQIMLNTSIPNGMTLTPQPQQIIPVKIDGKNEKTMQFELTWPSSCKLPIFTTFSTVPATCYFIIENFENPLFGSAGFEKTIYNNE